MKASVSVISSESVAKDDQEAIIAILQANNIKHGYKWAATPLSVILKNEEEQTVGGLIGSTNWEWLPLRFSRYLQLSSPRLLRKAWLRSLRKAGRFSARCMSLFSQENISAGLG